MSRDFRIYRTARNPRRCDMYRCYRTIQPGDRYVHCSLPPMVEPNSCEHWWSMSVCADCMSPDDRERAGLPAETGGALTAAEWNTRHPVGTPVVAYPHARGDEPILTTRTRSRAWELGHGAPVVAVDGYSGGICLTHVDPIEQGAMGGAS